MGSEKETSTEQKETTYEDIDEARATFVHVTSAGIALSANLRTCGVGTCGI